MEYVHFMNAIWVAKMFQFPLFEFRVWIFDEIHFEVTFVLFNVHFWMLQYDMRKKFRMHLSNHFSSFQWNLMHSHFISCAVFRVVLLEKVFNFNFTRPTDFCCWSIHNNEKFFDIFASNLCMCIECEPLKKKNKTKLATP